MVDGLVVSSDVDHMHHDTRHNTQDGNVIPKHVGATIHN
jgi:hypothetical protein